MDAIEAIRKRASVRAYKPDPLPREALEELVDCGRRAPSAMGVHPWHFVVVTERQALTALAAVTDYGRFIADAAACIVVLCEEGRRAEPRVLPWAGGKLLPYAWRTAARRSRMS